ncbi:hypothetical protein GEMRC1_011635 [Eukaryota sp. GEM-RC1]
MSLIVPGFCSEFGSNRSKKMFPLSHLLFSANVLLLFNQVTKNEMSNLKFCLLVVLGGLAIDSSQWLGWILGKPRFHLRTFIEEPLGLILVVVPIAGVIRFLTDKITALLYFTLTVLHLVLDYVSVPHRMSPCDPVVERVWYVQFPLNLFVSVSYGNPSDPHSSGLLSEWTFVFWNLVIFIVLLTDRAIKSRP